MTPSFEHNEPIPTLADSVLAGRPTGRISLIVGNSRPEAPPGAAELQEANARARIASEETGQSIPTAEAVHQQLSRILRSRVFIQSERLSRFLQFIVEHVINGVEDRLKEYVIGSEVYERRPPYHPSQDSIVRTEARRLRGKLTEYYAIEGIRDPLFICMQPGTYVPTFRTRKISAGPSDHMADNEATPLTTTVPGELTIAILPFQDISANKLSSMYARGIPDELAYILVKADRCKVISLGSMTCISAREDDLAASMRRAGAQIGYEGSVRTEGYHVRVTVRIVDAVGFQLWTKRFDANAESSIMFSLEEQIASELSKGLEGLLRGLAGERENIA
jgi:TolB-like protein